MGKENYRDTSLDGEIADDMYLPTILRNVSVEGVSTQLNERSKILLAAVGGLALATMAGGALFARRHHRRVQAA